MDYRGRGRHKEGVVEISGRMYRIEVAGDICLRRPRPTQGCRADEEEDDDDDDAYIDTNNGLGTAKGRLLL